VIGKNRHAKSVDMCGSQWGKRHEFRPYNCNSRLKVIMLGICHNNVYITLILRSGLFSVPVTLVLENKGLCPGKVWTSGSPSLCTPVLCHASTSHGM